MAKQIKHLVSKKKRRFTDHGFDLDLTYIRPNILAMGFPSENIEGIYRNHLDDVVRFLETYHGTHYKVYNLCAERTYDASKFQGRVASFPFEDHNAPPFPLFDAFCKDVSNFLSADSRNVAAVHCKAGKGRTGVMICAFFIYEGIFKAVPEALMFYDLKRTQNGKGVTIPSQRRYVEYYGYRKLHDLTVTPVKMLLHGFVFDGAPAYSSLPTYSVFFRVSLGKVQTYLSKYYEVDSRKKEAQTIMEIPVPVIVAEDVKIEFFSCRLGKKEKAFHIWLNTFFIHAAAKYGDEGLYSTHTSRLGSDLRLLPYGVPNEEDLNPLECVRRGCLAEVPKFLTKDPIAGDFEVAACAADRSPQKPIIVSLPRKDLDRAVKDKRVSKFFRVHCLFSPALQDSSDMRCPHSLQEMTLSVGGETASCQSVISDDSALCSSSDSESEPEDSLSK